MSLLRLKIEDLNTRNLQTRAALNEDTVQDYADAMERGDKFPAVTVFTDGAEYYLADGFHRVEALRRIGKKAVVAELQDGNFKAALLYALKANSTHGLRRTNADKRHALEMAWNAREELFGGEPSIALLAETCGVSVATVKNFRAANRVANLATLPPTRNANNGAISPKAEVIAKTPPTTPPSMAAHKTTPPPPQPKTENHAPVKRVGRDGKTYTVPPKAARPMPQTTGRCRFTDANGFCTNDAMQGGGFKCFGAGCGGREEVPLTTPVRSAAPTRKSGHAPNVMLDRFGVEIPMEIRAAFMDGTARDQIESMLQSTVRLLKGAMEAQDPSVAQYRQADLIELQNLLRTARFTRPYCVCRICQGNGRGSCSACHETGFQTEEQYKRNPKEFLA